MNKQRLKAVMVLNGDTAIELSKYLGISDVTLSNKINEKNGLGFKQSEIHRIKQRYNLSSDEIDAIFFSD